MFIGEAPGAEEERAARPFVGQAGKRLEEALREVGLARSDVFISNSVRCRPPLNRTPNAEEEAACLPYLLEEIAEVQPRLIVALGNAALHTLTGLKAITAARGRDLSPRRGLQIDTPIRATYHPAATLYDRRNWEPFVADMREIASLAAGATPPDAAADPYEYRLTGNTVTDAAAATLARQTLGKLRNAPYLTCDLEWTASPRAVQTAEGSTRPDMVWPWRKDIKGEVYSAALTGKDADGNLITVGLRMPCDLTVMNALIYLLSTRPVIFHNAMADMLWLSAAGILVKFGGDTLYLAHLLDETQPKKLEELCNRYLPSLPSWKGTTQRLHATRPATVQEWEEILIYNCRDARNTYLLHEEMIAEIKRQGRQQDIGRVYTKILIPAFPILLNAALQGVPVDDQRLRDETGAAQERMFRAVEELATITGTTPGDAQQIATSPLKTTAYLKRSLGLDIESSRKGELAEYRGLPAVDTISSIRKEQKYLGTYFLPWRKLLDRQGDGVLHTIYRPVGTRTGRLSAELEEGGSVHVAPRNDDRVTFRKLFKAKPGRLVLGIDGSQIELRAVAWIAREPVMTEIYERDRGLLPGVIKSDLHLRTACEVNRVSTVETATEIAGRPVRYDEAVAILLDYPELQIRFPDWKRHRQDAKGVNFGYCYGMREDHFISYARLQYHLEFTKAQATDIRNAYFNAYSGLNAWHETALRDVANTHTTITPFGRQRQYQNSDDYLSAINTPVQSAASDLTMLGMIQIDRALRAEGLDAVINGTVHDSVIIDVSWNDAERARAIALYEFENIDTSAWGFTVPVPIKAEAKLGETW